tara:strand:- start:133 stop:642 length:510 start_codon:yes stop_codon:yes gene_type:complete
MKSRILAVLLSLLVLSHCGQIEVVQNPVDPVMENRIANDLPLVGLGEDKMSLSELILGDGKNDLTFASSIVFETALDKLSFMPLASVDSNAGVIITDWYGINNNQDRIKINIRVINQTLENNSINVRMFQQKFDGSKWVDTTTDGMQSEQIKNSILEDARKLQATIDLS